MTTQQTSYLEQISKKRVILSGRSGTGKTLLALVHARRLAAKGQRVLFLVYNVALAEHINEDLKNAFITVLNFHALCRQATYKIGAYTPEEATNWYQEEGPKALNIAISRGMLPEYDALIVDEAQVFHYEWINQLVNWFNRKLVLICCDEKQVFSYEHQTSVKALEMIMQVEALTLTVNVRSPYSVFERLQQALPTTYQQISLRPNNSDTLVEIATFEPLEQLYITLRQLGAEGVPPQAIMIIYINKDKKPTYTPDIGKLFSRMISVHKCRGLEAPVVIVWNDGLIDDSLIACAYSRATSRCIAIYNVFQLTSEHLSIGENTTSGSAFRKILRQDVAEIRTAIQEVWPPTNTLHITSIVKEPVKIEWSHDWGGWLILRDEEKSTDWDTSNISEMIVTNLWKCHLIFVSDTPVYVLDGRLWWSTWRISVYTPTRSLHTILASQGWLLEWCHMCGRWTKGLFKYDNVSKQSTTLCLECNVNRQSYPVPTLTRHLSSLGMDLMTSSEITYEAQQRTIFLTVLQGWYALTQKQQEQLCEHIQSLDNKTKMSFWICKLLIGIDLVKAEYGNQIILAERQDYYWMRYPWLSQYISKEEWKKVVASSIGAWKTHQWLEKQDKGIYVCTPPTVIEDYVDWNDEEWLEEPF